MRLNLKNCNSMMKKIQIMTLTLTLSTNLRIKKTQIPSRNLSLQLILFLGCNLIIIRDLHLLCNQLSSQLEIKTSTILSSCLMTFLISSFAFRTSSILITFLSSNTRVFSRSLRKLLKLQSSKLLDVYLTQNAVWVKNLCQQNAQVFLLKLQPTKQLSITKAIISK